MKLDGRARLEIVEILRRGLMNGEDVSNLIRDLDLEAGTDGNLRLTDEYLSKSIKPIVVDG